ncbi:MAG: hypothetical protein RMJ15_04620 [Nitrososphaerota archaeon]|nr:hypothetical protein [Nitrososphaerota archaeon]
MHATFRKLVEERKTEGVLGIDVNEKSMDLALVKPYKVKISEAKYIRDRYFKKRRSIQSRTSRNIGASLLAKYSRRELTQ